MKNIIILSINHNNDKVSTSNIVNNLTTTASGKVLDARQGKTLNDKFGTMRFGIDSSGNYGYIKAGADTVIPFKSGSDVHIYDLGTGTSFNVSNYEGYENFTTDNFLYKVTNMTIPATSEKLSHIGHYKNMFVKYYNASIHATNAVSIIPTLSYNNTTGILSVTNTSLSLTITAYGGCEGDYGTKPLSTTVNQTYTCSLTIRMYLVV